MSPQKNERGYALLMVLFLVVLIMAISAVFLRGSISNAKQERIVDKNNLSVVIAEMGVDYFKATFTNRYYLVKKDIENNFKKELGIYMDNLRSEKTDKGRPRYTSSELIILEKKKVSELRIDMAQTLNDELQNSLDVQGSSKKISETADFFEVGLSPLNKTDYILIDGKVIGVGDNKESKLTLKMIFEIPQLWNDGEDTDEEASNNGSYNIGIVKNVSNIDEITALHFEDTKVDNSDHNVSNKRNLTIQSTKTLNKDQVQNNTGLLEIETMGDFKSSYFNNNEHIFVQTNGTFNTQHIQSSSGNVVIMVGKNFGSQSAINIVENKKDVSIYSNGSINANQVKNTDGNVDIKARTDFGNLSAIVIDNKRDVSILTNGKFTVDQVQNNKKQVTINAEKDFYSKTNVNGNGNVSILTNGSFKTEQIQNNIGFLEISSSNEFIAKHIDGNANTTFQTNKTFTALQIKNQSGYLKILATEDFRSEELEGNSNLSIQTNGDFFARTILNQQTGIHAINAVGSVTVPNGITNNYGMTIKSGGNVNTQQIENNKDFTIISGGNLDGQKMILRNNSNACVGGDLKLSGYLDLDNSSFLYMLSEGQINVQKTIGESQIKRLSKSEWEKKCSVELEPGTSPDPNIGGLKDMFIWEPPKVDVEYTK